MSLKILEMCFFFIDAELLKCFDSKKESEKKKIDFTRGCSILKSNRGVSQTHICPISRRFFLEFINERIKTENVRFFLFNFHILRHNRRCLGVKTIRAKNKKNYSQFCG